MHKALAVVMTLGCVTLATSGACKKAASTDPAPAKAQGSAAAAGSAAAVGSAAPASKLGAAVAAPAAAAPAVADGSDDGSAGSGSDAVAPASTGVVVTPLAADVALPAGTPKGAKVVGGGQFTDANGVNLVVMTASGTTSGAAPRRLLQVSHVVRSAAGDRELRQVKDLVECDAVTADFADDTLRVTDLDHDQLAEVSFAYSTWCDLSGDTVTKQKLLLLENGTKYILRHEDASAGGAGYGGEAYGESGGGGISPEPKRADWPAEFYAFARERWDDQF